MMPRLIDWDKVLEWMHRQKETTEQWSMRIAIENYVDEMPTVDAEPVVRCKDCKYFHYDKAYVIQGFPIMGNSVCDKWANGCQTDENGYCFLGERKEDG